MRSLVKNICSIRVVGEIELTKPDMLSWSERSISHMETGTRLYFLLVTAVRNFGQWAIA